MEDEKLAVDESQRTARHQAIKGEVREELQSEVARQAKQHDTHDRAHAAALGERFKEKAINELVTTEAEIERGRAAARVSQIVDYAFYVIYSLIGLKILLELLGAWDGSGFKNLIDTLAAPFLAPFDRLMPDLARGRFELKVSYLVALIVYLLLHLGVNGLLRMLAQRKTAI